MMKNKLLLSIVLLSSTLASLPVTTQADAAYAGPFNIVQVANGWTGEQFAIIVCEAADCAVSY
jgi:hypothetical protein